MSGSGVLKTGERLRKLRAMSVREIADRVRYKVALDRERRQYQRNTLASPDRLRDALRRDLQVLEWEPALLAARRTSPARFFPAVHAADEVRLLFATAFPAEHAATLEHAARTRQHRFEFFGHEFGYGADIDWQSDPVTGRAWPARYHADVPVHRGDIGCGDVKHVWELNRQQYLIDLAKGWFLDQNRDDLVAMRHLVRSWIAGNPYATGVNWSCALEPAFRVWSWLWAYHLTADALDEEFHLEWLCGFYDHGRFIAAHMEHYSSPFNHLVGEAAALFALGLCFPEFRDAAEWRRRGRRVLESRLAEQFYGDGGSVEQSTFYHHATLGFYLLAALLGRANGQELSARVWAAIGRALDFSAQLTQPDGRTPEIGGADDGKPIRMEHLPLWDFRPYQAIGAAVFERPDFKAVAGRFHEDALWLLGPQGYERFRTLPATFPEHVDAMFPASGYVVSRSDWSTKADYVCFDVGEQAAGMRTDAVANSMHGHADCLSVIVSLGGRRVLVDSGLYAYNCGGEWEAHFRETAAHNTARIDGRDQARHIGKMAWSHSYRVAIEDYVTDARHSRAIGSHDGYARGAEGVTHRRVVWRRAGGYVLICDEFVGEGAHDLEVNYQFAPGLLTADGEGSVIFDRFAELAWMAPEIWSSDIRCGGSRPDEGWICRSLGVREPAPRLTLRSRWSGGRTALLTVIADRGRCERRVQLVRDEMSGQVLAAIPGDHATDVIAFGPSLRGPVETDALVAVCAVDHGDGIESTFARGAYVHVDAAALARLTRTLHPVAAR